MLTKGFYNENNLESYDETHILVNIDIGHTVSFSGTDSTNNADVVSRGEGFKMVARITGDCNARVVHLFLVFQNEDHRYPIQSLSDDVNEVAFCTGLKGWTDRTVISQWLSEKPVVGCIPYRRLQILYVDTCSSHLSK